MSTWDDHTVLVYERWAPEWLMHWSMEGCKLLNLQQIPDHKMCEILEKKKKKNAHKKWECEKGERWSDNVTLFLDLSVEWHYLCTLCLSFIIAYYLISFRVFFSRDTLHLPVSFITKQECLCEWACMLIEVNICIYCISPQISFFIN